MKRLLFSVMMALAVVPLVYAENAAVMTPPKPAVKQTMTTVKTEALKLVEGTIEAVSATEITVVDKDGKKSSYIIKSTTPVFGAKGSSVMLQDLKAGEAVKVKYEVKNAVNEAISIYLTK